MIPGGRIYPARRKPKLALKAEAMSDVAGLKLGEKGQALVDLYVVKEYLRDDQTGGKCRVVRLRVNSFQKFIASNKRIFPNAPDS